MATDLVKSLRLALANAQAIELDPFGILSSLSRVVNEAQDVSSKEREAQELVLRALAMREHFRGGQRVLLALVRRQGLFPYLDPETLGLNDLLAYELNRPDNLGDDLVFHSAQSRIYDLLVDGNNVILSAPTSFGKSLIIDAIIATEKFSNVVIVVPTIALIDETRRRLVSRFGKRYKVITNRTQATTERNIFVLTQERVVELEGLPRVDFFVIDEFYKLDPVTDPDRANTLNEAFYRLHRTGAQFYLLGPNVLGIPQELPGKLECSYIATDYATVVSEYHQLRTTKQDRSAKLVGLCKELDDPTLIYCASPASARRVALALLAGGISEGSDNLRAAVDWISEAFHPDWILPRILGHGIGMHHGRMPRALSQYVVRAFNNGDLKYLICTSTLIEGVNTKAKNVIIYDNKVARRNFDFFTFNNIKGRSGRMGQHFIGNVYLFADPPQEDFPSVDVPMVTQGTDTATSLLLQLEPADLSAVSKDRLKAIAEQVDIPLSVLRENRGLAPESQIALAKEIADNLEFYNKRLAWNGYPTYEQFQTVCGIIWELAGGSGMKGGVVSAKQLAFMMQRFRQNPDISAFVAEAVQGDEDPDDAVENALDFLRYWVGYHFPRYLMALERIQRSVFARARAPIGEYSFLASQLENFFSTPGIAALDEYGVPLQLARKLSEMLNNPETLDDALAALKSINLEKISLDAFEQELLQDAISFL